MYEVEPNHRQTLAVFLGASSFPRAPKLPHAPALYNSAQDFREYLTRSDGLDLPPENVRWLFDDNRSPFDQLHDIQGFLEERSIAFKKEGLQPRDLIVYYVGYGLFSEPNYTLRLAVRATDERHDEFTTIRVRDLALIVRASPRFLREYLILDCGVSSYSSPEFERMVFQGELLLTEGTTVLFSASRPGLTLPPDDLSRTAFSNSLLRVLNRGSHGLGPRLSLRELGDLVETDVREAYVNDWVRLELHSWGQPDEEVGLFPNPAWGTQKSAAAAEARYKADVQRAREGAEARQRAEAGEAKRRAEAEPRRRAEAEHKAQEPEEASRKQAEAEDDATLVQVFYATDRMRIPSLTGVVKYGKQRSIMGNLHYGRCEVSIPKIHKIGKLETPSILRLEFRPNPKKHIILAKTFSLGEHNFFELLKSSVATTASKDAFVFIHGYNVSFEDAARRTGQIACDLHFIGAPIFYSWPSKGRMTAYLKDETNITWSTPHFEHFLGLLAEKSGAERIHIIAHSMGNRAVCDALKALSYDTTSQLKFNHLVLAAPDIDADTFRELAVTLQRLAGRVTLYESSRDIALRASKLIYGNPRAGEPVLVIPGMDTVDASAIDTDFLGHSFFSDNWPLLSDIHSILFKDEPPSDRFGLVAMEHKDGRYYAFRP